MKSSRLKEIMDNRLHFIAKSKWFDNNPDFIKLNKINDIKQICYNFMKDKQVKEVKKLIVNEMNITRVIGSYHLAMDDSIRGMIYDRFKV